ncbi:MAG: hypothetical protein M4D80_27150 [Myxococcota bacterium]|nr:hypothetical protein [Deltaproteobacteria bacterium]MDQ3338859.1 hypothetical protein [Myxococcota bacterium]
MRLEHVLHGEVQDLLDQLARALIAGDGEAVAALWETPAFVIGSDGVTAISSREQVAKFFGGVKYNADGVKRTRADLLDLERVGNRIVIAAVRWPHLDAADREMNSESSDYTLRRDDNGKLKIRAVLMRGTTK